ncbi:hypothetical protein ABPG75_013220 [Micractinium tetrahymenae]
MAADPPSTPFTLLEYEYCASGDELKRVRQPYLEGHLQALEAESAAGRLYLYGPLGDPISGGFLVWRETSEEQVRAFMASDPFMAAGLVVKWSIRPYFVVGGAGAPK